MVWTEFQVGENNGITIKMDKQVEIIKDTVLTSGKGISVLLKKGRRVKFIGYDAKTETYIIEIDLKSVGAIINQKTQRFNIALTNVKL